jgi:hypothetical protein
MRKLLVGECAVDNIYRLVDPTKFFEIDFEAEVVKALNCLMPDYWCGVFAGTFLLEGDRRKADLALIHKTLSHWFVVEVELAGHSFDQHILPQVRCFRYGEPDHTCETSLLNAFKFLDRDQAHALLMYVPRYALVIGNLPNSQWTLALRALDVQHLTVLVYRNQNGQVAYELEGAVVVHTESLGFAHYSEIDKCLRISKGCGLPLGNVQIIDQFGTPASWTVREAVGTLWISKDRGPTLLDHDSYVHIVRTFDGKISLKPSLPRISRLIENKKPGIK